MHQSNHGRDPEHGSNYSGFHGWVIEATTGAVAPSTKPPHLYFPPLLLPSLLPSVVATCDLVLSRSGRKLALISLRTSFPVSLSLCLPVTLNAHCMSIYSKLVSAESRVQCNMGEQYLNDCVTLLLDVECCHGFGTKHLYEYAEQLQWCVIYTECVYFCTVCVWVCAHVCVCLREWKGQWRRTFCWNDPILLNPVGGEELI